MRILHLTTEFPPVIFGGLGTAVGGLVNASAAAGLEVGVMLIGGHGGSTYGTFVEEPDAIVVGATRETGSKPARFSASWSDDADTIAQMARSWAPTILHLHSFWAWPLARSLRERLGVPLVYTVHSLDRAEYELGDGPTECLTQWVAQDDVIRGADRVIALTESERTLLEQYCPGVGERVRVVGNGIDCTVPLVDVQRSDQGAPVVLFTGRFVARKGIHELIEALPIVLDAAPQTRFVLAGGHRHCSGAQMEAWLLPEGCTRYREQVQFTGWLTADEMAAWYQASDILVVPSWYEPFGMVLLEGMVHGLAIAASKIGGPAEILDHGRTGLLFPPRDACALAGAIVDLVQDPGRRNRLAMAGAREVRSNWRWSRMVERMRRVYRELSPVD